VADSVNSSPLEIVLGTLSGLKVSGSCRFDRVAISEMARVAIAKKNLQEMKGY
jgi:hypothetical protein